ncbi:hypothetical protein TWF481_011649 [Arthrobotrys musiformis]|uniref:Uncharacterized protein n=1 Tax=Arthrobotrys musiformis TaxID=47236 RepID=A0AAV9VYX1_9PEZI
MAFESQYYSPVAANYLVLDSSFFDATGAPDDAGPTDIDPNIDPNLETYQYTPPSDTTEQEEAIRFPQQNHSLATSEHETVTNRFYFRCGCCGERGPEFTEDMITFQICELRPEEDLLLCWTCWTEYYPGLEKWRVRPIFKPTAMLPETMIRALAPRSFHNKRQSEWQTEYIPPHQHNLNQYRLKVYRRWLIPGIPYIWPLWSVKNGSKVPPKLSAAAARLEGKRPQEFESFNSPVKELPQELPQEFPEESVDGNTRKKEPIIYHDHIAGYMGRYRSTICTKEEIAKEHKDRPNKELPINLFGRYEFALNHINKTLKFGKYHCKDTPIEDAVDVNSQDDVFMRGSVSA